MSDRKLATAKKGNVRPRGSVNIFGWVLLLGLVAGIYAAVIFIPVYMDHLTVKEAARAGLSDAKQLSDDAIVEFIANYVNLGAHQVGTHMEEDPEDGVLKEVRGLGLTAQNITVERNEAAKSITVTIDYTRKVILKPTTQVRAIRFYFVHKEALPL